MSTEQVARWTKTLPSGNTITVEISGCNQVEESPNTEDKSLMLTFSANVGRSGKHDIGNMVGTVTLGHFRAWPHLHPDLAID